MSYLKSIWTKQATIQLRDIFDYYKYVKKTPQGAQAVKSDIISATKTIRFPEQYQHDEIQPQYRRVIVRHFKILYKLQDDSVYILRIFSTHQHPDKQ